jgi:hypothetical protein
MTVSADDNDDCSNNADKERGFTALFSCSNHMPLTCGYVFRGEIWGRRRPLCVRVLGAGSRVTHGRARTVLAGGWAFTPPARLF